MNPCHIIIADSLTNDFLNPQIPFTETKVNIGKQEIQRLMGDDPYGSGVLPLFLAKAIEITKSAGNVHVILVRDHHNPNDQAQQPELLRYGNHGLIGSPGAAFVAPIVPLLTHAHVLNTHTLALPIHGFCEVMASIIHTDILALDANQRQQIHFTLIGCHTDKRILGTAHMLRNSFGFANVAVCPHLLGSANKEAHFTALKSLFPDALIKVIPSIQETAVFSGIPTNDLDLSIYSGCQIHPKSISDTMNSHQQMVIKTAFMEHSKVRLHQLTGGFSGSFLFLVHGKKGNAKTEPVVLKIDHHRQMQKELAGYDRVKIFLGKNAPTFCPPISCGESTGIEMELAAMHGSPQTLQDNFENAESDPALTTFLATMENALCILKAKLYDNTKKIRRFNPYKAFLLHSRQQYDWLVTNSTYISPGEPSTDTHHLNILDQFPEFHQSFREIVSNTETVTGAIALSHGDLNLANIIFDEKMNSWIIDWTHADEHPVALDFAKLENDIKFVISKDFLPQDITHIHEFEQLILSTFLLPEIATLPKQYAYIRYDFRFKKIYLAIQKTRTIYASIIDEADDLVYKIALLRYSSHTMSFDKRRNCGECDIVQLQHAMIASALLVMQLKAHDFHRKTTNAKLPAYPQRQRVALHTAAWNQQMPDYTPPYYVHSEIIANDRTKTTTGWADPEDIRLLTRTITSLTGPIHFDDIGRPLNPKGRTGIAGRGTLGSWGPNIAVDPVVTRINPENGNLEVIIGIREDTGEMSLPGGIVLEHETPTQTLVRSFHSKTGTSLDLTSAIEIFKGYSDDYRNTDHAWMETIATHCHVAPDAIDHLALQPGKGLTQVSWTVITPELINKLFASHSDLVKIAINNLLNWGKLATDDYNRIMLNT